MNTAHAAAFDVSDAYPWILYLDPSVHTDEASLVTNAGLEPYVHLQDVRKATGARPAWMSVLPALVDTKRRKAYRGPTCLHKLVSIELPREYLRRLNKPKATVW